MSLLQISLPLCSFGFLSEIFSLQLFHNNHASGVVSSSEPDDDVQSIINFRKYSDLFVIIGVLLVTDLLRYKTVLILKATSAILLCCLILWTSSVGAYNFSTVVYSLYTCCEVAYIAYIFDKVSNENFLTVSSLTRAAPLAGRFLFYLLPVTLIPEIGWNVHVYLALAIQIVTLVVAAILLSFYSINQNRRNLQTIPGDMLEQLKSALLNERVRLWSLWWIVGMGSQKPAIDTLELIIGFFHSRQDESTWDGLFMAITMALSIVFVVLSTRMTFIDRKRNTLIFLAVVSFSSSALLFLSANIDLSRVPLYAVLWLNCILFYTTITISSAEIAKGIPRGSYGLIFGILYFIAICLRVIVNEISGTVEIRDDLFAGSKLSLNLEGGLLASAGFTYLCFIFIFQFLSSNTVNSGVVMSSNTGQV